MQNAELRMQNYRAALRQFIIVGEADTSIVHCTLYIVHCAFLILNSQFCINISLGKMNMIINVILTEAVIALTLGAVTELQLGMLPIRSDAYGTFVIVKVCLLIPPDLCAFPSEIDDIRAGALRQKAHKITAAEDDKIDHGNDRKKICREGRCKDPGDKQDSINNGEIFDLERNNEKQKHLHIRVERRKREEHTQIYILRRKIEIYAEKEVDHKAVNHRQQNAGEEIDGKLRCPPLAFQRCADQIIKIDRDKGQKTAARRVHGVGDKPPDLPMQDRGGIEREIAHQHGIDRTDQPEYHIADADVFHQIRNAEIRMLTAKTVDKRNAISHRKFS